MKEPVWILDDVVQAVHTMLLAEHGGGDGIRDKSLLDSALARAKQKYAYQPDISIYELAATYSFGLAKNHPFVDGNKRTAFVIGTLFLELNGYTLEASEPDAAVVFEKLAAGEINESELSGWFKKHCSKD
ncbi:type II toxin-antitoxin system death-on-curing family toxin [Porticoccus sp. W117]|uniref:type II toxin-antitoxin system death-on-curing family toxin n=1 Tax=Porticoccus sp. W117 TaxID=3054777 RepID=UPI002596F3C4|nr:type II toxin-antitoxin system death-on-curing family toxin [Porticoccus sp. W117]MDM3870246.1 type II toxin-antitoxin system death-on-curing family toxin [Porticoccus sp. W117]